MTRQPPRIISLPIKAEATRRVLADRLTESPTIPHVIISALQIASRTYIDWLLAQPVLQEVAEEISSQSLGSEEIPAWVRTETERDMVALGSLLRSAPPGERRTPFLSCTDHVAIVQRKLDTGEPVAETDYQLAIAGLHHTPRGARPNRRRRRSRTEAAHVRACTHFLVPNSPGDLLVLVAAGIRGVAAFDQVRVDRELVIDLVEQEWVSPEEAAHIIEVKADRVRLDPNRQVTWKQAVKSIERWRRQRGLPPTLSDPEGANN